MKTVRLVHLEFNRLRGQRPERIYAQFVALCRMSRKRIFPRSLTWDSYAVIEHPEAITIHLARDGKDVALFSFVPHL